MWSSGHGSFDQGLLACIIHCKARCGLVSPNRLYQLTIQIYLAKWLLDCFLIHCKVIKMWKESLSCNFLIRRIHLSLVGAVQCLSSRFCYCIWFVMVVFIVRQMSLYVTSLQRKWFLVRPEPVSGLYDVTSLLLLHWRNPRLLLGQQVVKSLQVLLKSQYKFRIYTVSIKLSLGKCKDCMLVG